MCDRRKQSHRVLGISETPKGVTVVVICAVYITVVPLSTLLHGAIAGDTAHPSSLFISLLLDCFTTWAIVDNDLVERQSSAEVVLL